MQILVRSERLMREQEVSYIVELEGVNTWTLCRDVTITSHPSMFPSHRRNH
jgi:hypothetical protein